jgi:hypothetical protein
MLFTVFDKIGWVIQASMAFTVLTDLQRCLVNLNTNFPFSASVRFDSSRHFCTAL